MAENYIPLQPLLAFSSIDACLTLPRAGHLDVLEKQHNPREDIYGKGSQGKVSSRAEALR